MGEADTVKLRQGKVKQGVDFRPRCAGCATREQAVGEFGTAQWVGSCVCQKAEEACAGGAQQEAVAQPAAEHDDLIFVPVLPRQPQIVGDTPGLA
jgi:hypothetical protein